PTDVRRSARSDPPRGLPRSDRRQEVCFGAKITQNSSLKNPQPTLTTQNPKSARVMQKPVVSLDWKHIFDFDDRFAPPGNCQDDSQTGGKAIQRCLPELLPGQRPPHLSDQNSTSPENRSFMDPRAPGPEPKPVR